MSEYLKQLLDQFSLPLSNPVLSFSIILFIILIAPILLKRLNIPGIIGLIISGVIIGPYGFHLLEKNSAVDLFSTIGLLYIMFIAGLELDMNEFKANRKKSLLFGLFTFIVPLTFGFPICYYFLEYDFNASLLISSMFSTHTLIAYPIVSKLGVSKNQSVAITVGGTILTDTAVLIILAVILGNHQGGLTQEFWIRMGISLAVFTFFMFYIVPKVSRWFFRKLESEKHSHYIYVLSVVFLAAFLAQIAGVEPIIGAFLAGLALNRLIPHSSALMNRIEFIGNSLFIPFFLISVGMIVDIRVILNGPQAIIIAIVLTIVALIGKWLAAFFTQISLRYTSVQRQLIFGLSSSHAAATLAVILVGYKAGILDENVLNGTVILILVTCIVASFVAEKSAKKIVLDPRNDLASANEPSVQKEEHILVPMANLLNFEKLLEFALFIKNKKSVNPVSILSVVPNNEDAEANILKSRALLDDYVKQASASESKVSIVTTIDHNAASGITRTAQEIMADIIIIGWPHRSGFLAKFTGEKTDSIINNTDKTILICQLKKPLITTRKTIIIAPPLSEREAGFDTWFIKMAQLAKELSVTMEVYGNKDTLEAVSKNIRKYHLSVMADLKEFNDWEDFLILSKEIQATDFLIFATSRKGSISYSSLLENIINKIEKHFVDNSKLIIYPQQIRKDLLIESYKDISGAPLTRGLEAFEQLGKGIGSIFKKENETED